MYVQQLYIVSGSIDRPTDALFLYMRSTDKPPFLYKLFIYMYIYDCYTYILFCVRHIASLLVYNITTHTHVLICHHHCVVMLKTYIVYIICLLIHITTHIQNILYIIRVNLRLHAVTKGCYLYVTFLILHYIVHLSYILVCCIHLIIYIMLLTTLHIIN